ncbi:general substrate transporter [Lipomyces starkeyi]
MFCGGKIMNFVSIGAFVSLCTSYVAEISPLAIRSSVIGFCNLSQCIGPFISAIMSYFTSRWETDWSWQSLICAQWGFAAVAFVGQIFMPESPIYLVRKGKMTAARKVLGHLYSDPLDADGHLERIKLTLEEAETQNSSSYIDCFRGTNLRRTLIAIMVFLSEPMSGLGFVSSYGALMYQYLGIGDQKSFAIQIGAQILSLSGATIAFLVSDFYGRRPMYLGGCIALCLLLICMGISGSVNTTAGITASVGFYTMYNFFYNVGVGSTVYTIAGEVPTSVLRAKTLAVALSSSAAATTMWSFVSPFIFNPGYGNLKAKIGFVFGAFMLVFAVMANFFVPETRMRTYEELDELFMNHVPTRQFRSYVTVAEQRAAEAYNAKKTKIPLEQA